jgi:hypothetical protein
MSSWRFLHIIVAETAGKVGFEVELTRLRMVAFLRADNQIRVKDRPGWWHSSQASPTVGSSRFAIGARPASNSSFFVSHDSGAALPSGSSGTRPKYWKRPRISFDHCSFSCGTRGKSGRGFCGLDWPDFVVDLALCSVVARRIGGIQRPLVSNPTGVSLEVDIVSGVETGVGKAGRGSWVST